LITHKTNHCIDEEIILIAILRTQSISARLESAKVRNHIAVEQIIDKFSSDVLVPGSSIKIYLHNK
jgi:CRISPR/Cas system CSM-associated protein Csm3 (group 7 of RAMP superfamily)